MKKLTPLCLFGLSLYIISCQSNGTSSYQPFTQKTDQELRLELKQKERQEFSKYLKADCTMRENLIGEKVIEGTLSNSADLASFKDMVLEITFMSKTGTELNVQQHTVYELLAPKETKRFKKIKMYAPKATEQFSVRIIDVTPAD